MKDIELACKIAADLWKRRPAWAGGSVGQEDMRFLAELLAVQRPSAVLEIGVASGLSAALAVEVTSHLGAPCKVYGIDTQAEFFLDPDFRTGQLVGDLCGENASRFKLLIADSAAHAMRGVNEAFDFAFIDGNHLHPWPTFDLLSVLPSLNVGAWVTFHDINLNLVPRSRHRHRGSKYVFEHWYDEKKHSNATLPMIGAIRMEAPPLSYFDRIVDLLFTPAEETIPEPAARALAGLYTASAMDGAPILEGLGYAGERQSAFVEGSGGRHMCELVFNDRGNFQGILGVGWSVPEKDRIWMTGPRSEMRIPISEPARKLARTRGLGFRVELIPFTVPGKRPTQRLSVVVDGKEIIDTVINTARVLMFQVDPGVTGSSESIHLRLDHPDCSAPDTLIEGSVDRRALSFALRRLSVQSL